MMNHQTQKKGEIKKNIEKTTCCMKTVFLSPPYSVTEKAFIKDVENASAY